MTDSGHVSHSESFGGCVCAYWYGGMAPDEPTQNHSMTHGQRWFMATKKCLLRLVNISSRSTRPWSTIQVRPTADGDLSFRAPPWPVCWTTVVLSFRTDGKMRRANVWLWPATTGEIRCFWLPKPLSTDCFPSLTSERLLNSWGIVTCLVTKVPVSFACTNWKSVLRLLHIFISFHSTTKLCLIDWFVLLFCCLNRLCCVVIGPISLETGPGVSCRWSSCANTPTHYRMTSCRQLFTTN